MYRPIAQWTEHQIPVLGAEGSNPSWPTEKFILRVLIYIYNYIIFNLHLAGFEPAMSQ